MRIRYACIALLVFTTMPALTEDTTWRHCVGLRVGGVGIIPFSYSLATFHEAQSYRNLAIRSALETTNGKEWTIYGDMGYGIDISRVGAAVDFIYYTSYERPIGTGFFTMAGIGAHRFDIKDQMFQNVLSDRQTAASFSLGIGYVGKKFGVELKRYMSNQDSAVAAGIGRDWFQTSMIFRFPMPGQAKVEFARDVNWSAKKNAEKIAEENESIQSAPQHKIGLRFGGVDAFNVGGGIFYEHQFDRHWAIRPTIELTKGSEQYRETPSNSVRYADVDRVGLAMDCIYYTSGRWKNGTKFYLLAGIGIHRIDMKDELALIGAEFSYKECSALTPALSVGLGYYFGRFFGIEYKHTFSALNTPFPKSFGKDWMQFTLNFRLPLIGLPKL